MSQPSQVLSSLRALHESRTNELFRLDRIRREWMFLRQLEAQSVARLNGVHNKIRWEERQLKREQS